MSKYTYELNYYPIDIGDGIYTLFNTKAQALKEFKRLEKKYPNRNGDAFINVWINYGEYDCEIVLVIDLS